MQIYIFIVLLLAVLASVFAVQNSSQVDLNFLGWTFRQVSLVMVIVISFTVGVLVTLLLGLPRQIRTAVRMRELTGQNHRLGEEVEKLQVELKKQRKTGSGE